MSNPAVQLTFTLRTSPNVRTVHLLGSWDNYKNQLPLSAVKSADAKPGSWKGTFRFQGSQALKLGSRYWYYYCVDGYHVSHDPAKEHVVEPTTGRKLNVLDVPRGDGKDREPARASAKTSESTYKTKRDSRHGVDVPIGRALSPGKIQHPKPTKAYASRQIREADYDMSPVDAMEDLGEELSKMDLARHRHAVPSKYSNTDSDSDLSGSSSSFSGSYDRSSPGSFTSVSSAPSCRCERFGVTRHGERVKLDCGGKVCGYTSGSDSPSTGSDCSSESGDSEDERERIRAAYEAAKAKNRHAANGVGTKKVIEERSSRHAAPKSSGRSRR